MAASAKEGTASLPKEENYQCNKERVIEKEGDKIPVSQSAEEDHSTPINTIKESADAFQSNDANLIGLLNANSSSNFKEKEFKARPSLLR